MELLTNRNGKVFAATLVSVNEFEPSSFDGKTSLKDGFVRAVFFDDDKEQVAIRNSRTGEFDILTNQKPKHSDELPSGDSVTFWDVLEDHRIEKHIFEAQSELRDIDGLHADEALDEIVKLSFVASQLRLPPINPDSANFFEIAEFSSAIRDGLRQLSLNLSSSKQSNEARESDSKLIASDYAVTRAYRQIARINWSVETTDPSGRLIQNILRPAIRSGMGQYFTPPQVIQMVIQAIPKYKKARVLDPFCGSGEMLRSAARYEKLSSMAKSQWKFFGFDKSHKMAHIAAITNKVDGFPSIEITEMDTLAIDEDANESFDAIVTNPPFGVSLHADYIQSIGKYYCAKMYKKLPIEVVALERSTQLLKPSGWLSIVLPEGLLANDKYASFRNWISSLVTPRAVIGLPEHTFVPFGASVRTSVLIAQKTAMNKDDHVLTMTLDDVGYDTTFRATFSEDLSNALTILQAHLEKFSDVE
jgi:type I restriction enzyme M protein